MNLKFSVAQVTPELMASKSVMATASLIWDSPKTLPVEAPRNSLCEILARFVGFRGLGDLRVLPDRGPQAIQN